MIKEFVDSWEANKSIVEDELKMRHPDSYEDLVELVIKAVTTNDYDSPDPNRITVVDDGDYQGTLVFIIAGCGYQPNAYWFVKVSYGSCSGCDTLQGISGYSDDPPTEKQISEYMNLCLHIVQRLKSMNEDEEE